MRARIVFTGLWLLGLIASNAMAQRPIHYFHAADLPTGQVARELAANNPALRGYVQPVEARVPDGALVSVSNGGAFEKAQRDSVLAGMQVGQVYQLRVSNIPFNEGFEVFPTIEVINRIYPPEGAKVRFPIPVQITQEELEMALSGRLVTRVIYLEDPESAFPRREDPENQRYVEAPPGEDPLRVADRLGRPVAILRMGSRVPDYGSVNQGLGFGGAPLVIYPPQKKSTRVRTEIDAVVERQKKNIPRVPINPRTQSNYPLSAPPQ